MDRKFHGHMLCLKLLVLALLVGSAKETFAQTQITTINTCTVTPSSSTCSGVPSGLTTSSYSATAPSDAGAGPDGVVQNETYTINFGQVQNLFVTSYVAGGSTYDNFVLPDTLIIRRTDAGSQLVIFYEYDNIDNTDPRSIDIDAEQQTNEDALYQSGLLNAGYDNILVNNATNFANVERIDIIYNSGVVTSSPSTAVFPIVDRGGNDDIRVAAISSLDANGDPSGYYPTVVQVNNNGTNDWGDSGIAHISLVMRRQDAASNPLPQAALGTQNIHGSAVSFSDFGVSANEIVYGYSIFADDVTATGNDLVDFTNATNYPTNTGSASGLDLVAGISTAVASDNNLIMATGPGGYKAALTTWLKANEDADVTTSTDGSTVTDWQDHALGDHDATTLFAAPTYESDAVADINFNPTVDFVDASETGLQIANNSDFNTATSYEQKGINIVFRTGNDITTRQQIYEQGSNDRGINIFIDGGSLVVGAWNVTNDGTGSPWDFNSISTSSITTETEYIVTLEFDGNSAETGSVTAYLNGASMGSFSNVVGLLFSDTDGIGIGDTNSQSRYGSLDTTPAASFYGSIPEFIYCNEPGSFSTAQRDRIESYLALKYGITLDQTTANNYVNSDGDIIFNTTNAAAIGGYLEYNNDIAGIGRDDNSEFLQIQSQSENVNSIVEMHRSVAAGIGTNNTWMIWGNDGGATTSSRIVTKPDNINERIERVWRVAEEGSMGVTDISFDLTGLGFGTTASDFSLLVAGNSSGADFSSATVITGGTFNGDVITFTDVNLADGAYFTLGTQFFICTPGNVQDGLSLWLKADAETYNEPTGTTPATDGNEVDYWGDQSRNNFDAVEGSNTANRPTWIETDVNFNPTIRFGAGSNETGFNLGSNYVFAPEADGGVHIFAAVEPESSLTGSSRNRKMVLDFGNAANNSYGMGVYGDRGAIVVEGTNNFNISPSASNFLADAEINDTGGTSDEKSMYVDGQIDDNTPISETNIDVDDSGITQASTHGSNQGPVSIGRQSETNNLGNNAGRRYFGDLHEVILYNQALTPIQEQRIRSYLAIKYGTTLSNNNDGDGSINEVLSGSVVEGDYVASDGTTITFDYSDDTGFVTNVAGIGRDDDTCLNQKQSRSVNSDAILTVGLGEIASNNAANSNSFDDDLDFFTWGSDGASTAFANITTSGTPGTVNERMLRIWRAQDTGNVGATDISFDLTGLTGYSTNAGDYQLIVASGGDNTSLEAGTTITGGTFNGTVLTFDNVDLTDGQYFTLGVSADLCGPGGVTSSMVLWLRSDAGTSTTTDNTSLATWTDQSTAGNDGTEATDQPTFKDNTTDNINFHPTIDFDGINDRLSVGDLSEIKSVTGTGNYTMLGVGIRQDANDNYVLGSTGGTNDEELYFGYSSANTTATLDHENNAINLTGLNAFDNPAQTPFLLFGEYDGTGRIFEELRDDNFNQNTDSNTTDIGGTQTNYIGDVTNTGNYNGLISEVLVYNSGITDLEKLRIYSYFAIKYGITLPQDNDNDLTLNEVISGSVAEGDLVASDGTTIIWDESNNNSSYHNGMAGIGRDDDACLNQKQSTSATDGTILTIGLGSVATDNAANSGIHDNLDFLVWGHDGATTSPGSSLDVPSTVSQRMPRVWRVEDTGSVGATEIQFDLTGLGYGTNADDFRLIVSNTSTMADGTLTAGGTFNGDVLSFTGIDLTDGQYFTLGTALTTCGPGGVNTNISLWLRADLEVYSDAGLTLATDGQNVQQWNDQSSPADNASEVDGGGGAPVEPTFETNEINYNPALLITDQNTTNNSYMETSLNSVSGDMTLISVFNTAQNQGSTTDFSQAPALIGANSSGTDDYGLGLSNGQLHFNAANNSSLNARSTGTYNDGEPYIATGTRVQAVSGAINLYANSASVATGTSDNTALSGPSTFAIGNHSTYTNAGQFQGDIAEAIVFSRVLTSGERTQVESYLAIKYGITRDVSGLSAAEQDYLAGDGGIIWDYDAQGTNFHNDIAGIGRDDLSCFEQPHSKSENDDAIVDIEIGSFSSDDSWLIWGNDNAAIEATRNTERPATINSRLNREWRVQETGTIGSVSVTFDISAITGTPTGDNNLNLLRMMVDNDDDFSDATILVEPTSIDAVAKTATFTYDFTSGDYYTLGSSEQDALPITLISFNASVQENNTVKVDWTTAQEVNNALFSIERSENAVDFEVIGFKEGAGDSNAILEYSFIDNEPLEGISYYRLVQTDFNGQFTTSQLSRIELKSENHPPKLYPNPIRQGQELHIQVPVKVEDLYQVVAVGTSGQIKYSSEKHLQKGLNELVISTTNFNQGLHLIRVSSSKNGSIIMKLLVR